MTKGNNVMSEKKIETMYMKTFNTLSLFLIEESRVVLVLITSHLKNLSLQLAALVS